MTLAVRWDDRFSPTCFSQFFQHKCEEPIFKSYFIKPPRFCSFVMGSLWTIFYPGIIKMYRLIYCMQWRDAPFCITRKRQRITGFTAINYMLRIFCPSLYENFFGTRIVSDISLIIIPNFWWTQFPGNKIWFWKTLACSCRLFEAILFVRFHLCVKDDAQWSPGLLSLKQAIVLCCLVKYAATTILKLNLSSGTLIRT